MVSILRAGGLGSGGLNFDAKLRRPSIDLEDLFYAHIGGMDAYALAFKLARKILAEGKLEHFVADRYAAMTAASAATSRRAGSVSRNSRNSSLQAGRTEPRSGRQEYLENLLASYLHG